MQNPENLFFKEYENLLAKSQAGSELNKNTDKKNNGKSQHFQNNLNNKNPMIFKVEKENKFTKKKDNKKIKTENNVNNDINNFQNEDLSLRLFQDYDNDLFQNEDNQLNKEMECLENDEILSNVESNIVSNNAYLRQNNNNYKTEENVINYSRSQRIEISGNYNTETIYVGKGLDLK